MCNLVVGVLSSLLSCLSRLLFELESVLELSVSQAAVLAAGLVGVCCLYYRGRACVNTVG